ncbi:MAG TPA: TIGR01777 family oxidoreductase [Catenuloplanes sp.]
MRILFAGSSGFLGTRLLHRLRADGHQVTRLVRRRAKGDGESRWDPAAGQIDPAVVSAADVVVNLAGAGVGDKRWTESYKNVIRSSRVDTTHTLATAIAATPAVARPRALLNSSAVGWYGDTGDRPVEEDAPAGDGFLADVCRVWEAAARPAEDAGVRVALLRTGLPLHATGGLLKPQLLAFKLGVGGKLGSGRQWVPWISLEDWLASIGFLLARTDISGPVNLVGPAPVTNAEFTKALGAAVHRPAVMPIPTIGLKVALGGFAGEALRSARVLPGVLHRTGFEYAHPSLQAGLHAALTTP